MFLQLILMLYEASGGFAGASAGTLNFVVAIAVAPVVIIRRTTSASAVLNGVERGQANEQGDCHACMRREWHTPLVSRLNHLTV